MSKRRDEEMKRVLIKSSTRDRAVSFALDMVLDLSMGAAIAFLFVKLLVELGAP